MCKHSIILIFLFLPNFNEFFYFITPALFLLCFYNFFFRINSILVKNSQNGTIYNNNISVNFLQVLINFGIFICFLNYIYFYTIRGVNRSIWFNHFIFNNFSIYMLYIFIFVGFVFLFLIKTISKKNNLIKTHDYVLSIISLIFLLPYLFCVNSIICFLFFLELISAILFYKLVSSKIFYKNSIIKSNHNDVPQNYINMVFFQYWVTFFSTIFIIYFYINMFSLFGTSDWSTLQYCNIYDKKKNSISANIYLLLFFFIVSVFLKLGIAPLHLFKVEVYNGLPFITIFFYTTFYFLIFFIFFIFFIFDYLWVFTQQMWLCFYFFTLFGSLCVTVLLFDVSLIKAFFAYSTIINSIGFLIIIISSF